MRKKDEAVIYISIVIRRFRRFSLNITKIIRRDASTSRQNVRTNTDERNIFNTAEGKMILSRDRVTNASTSYVCNNYRVKGHCTYMCIYV